LALGGFTLAGCGGSSTEKPFRDSTILELQAQLASGALTSVQLVRAYLDRIAAIDGRLHSVLETDPDAVATAATLDAERKSGTLRGPLHGIPILVKDNIAVAGSMQTTAGSLALIGAGVAGDSVVAARLRAAGAIILGKTNLSEWANFRGNAPFNGWSARGGFTRNPYLLSADPGGSSSGSAVATAANLCAAAVGTETDGSIVYPASQCCVVGLKPTVGLISQAGIIPIAASQDTAGPMTRTVTDAAILLGVLQSPFGPAAGQALPSDYLGSLQRGALRGARLGMDSAYFSPGSGLAADQLQIVQQAIEVARRLGAQVFTTDTAFDRWDDEYTVLLYEFRAQIGGYLAGLPGPAPRTLEELVAFNTSHCAEEMRFFGQEVFEQALLLDGDLTSPTYLGARERCLQASRTSGIDLALAAGSLDAILAPSTTSTSPAAVAGYPNLSLPVGFGSSGLPVGMSFYAGPLSEPKLLALAYDLEQELQARRPPEQRGSAPADPPDAGLCPAGVAARTDLRARRSGSTW
jgi:amidase